MIDGLIFGAAGAQAMAQRGPAIREMAGAAGKGHSPIHGLAYVALGDDPKRALEAGDAALRYTAGLGGPPRS